MLTFRALPVLLAMILLGACGKDPVPQTESQPAASTAQAPAKTGNVHEFKIGELTAFALKDGTFLFPNDTKVFGVGRSSEDVAKVLAAAGVPTDELSLSIQPLLVKVGKQTLLFDTGAGSGAGETAGRLVTSMREAGIEPSDVTDIFISHAHGDHIGGLVDASGALVFANATVHISSPEWDAVKAAAESDANRAAQVQAWGSKVKAFAPGLEILPNVVKGVEIKGHTPGHSGYLITSGAESLLYIGDSAHHYVVSVQEPEWTIQFDRDASTAQASRKEMISTNAEAGQRIYAVHFPFPGLGRFKSEGRRFVWDPES